MLTWVIALGPPRRQPPPPVASAPSGRSNRRWTAPVWQSPSAGAPHRPPARRCATGSGGAG